MITNDMQFFCASALSYSELKTEGIRITKIENLVEFYYPHKTTLVVNTIINCFEDENIFNQRLAFDFINTHLQIEGKLLSRNEKETLAEAGLYTILKKNETLFRRLNAWLFDFLQGNKELKEIQIGKEQQDILDVITCSIQRLLKTRQISIEDQNNLEQFKQKVFGPMLIIKKIEEESDKMYMLLLPGISKNIIRYLEFYMNDKKVKENLPSQFFNDLITGSSKLFLAEESRLLIVWQVFADELAMAFKQNNVKQALDTITLIKFFLTNIYLKADSKAFASQNRYIQPMFARLLMTLKFPTIEMQTMENLLPMLKLIKEIIVNVLQSKPLVLDEKSTETMKQGLSNYFSYYENFLDFFIQNDKDDKKSQLIKQYHMLDLFTISTQVAISLQVYSKQFGIVQNTFEKIVGIILTIKSLLFKSVVFICIEAVLKICELALVDKNSYGLFREAIFSPKKNHAKEIMKNLWVLLGQSSINKKLVELFISAEKVMEAELLECIVNDLTIAQKNDIDSQLAAIQRFSKFWKGAAEYFPEYTILKASPLPISQMLDFLNHDHPLIRHASKSWLESIKRLNKIFDVILKRMLVNANDGTIEKEKGKLIYTVPYDTQLILTSLKQFRGILLSHKEETMNFLEKGAISPEILKLYEGHQCRSMFDFMIDKKNNGNIVLFTLTKFIIGTHAESSKTEFVVENAAVNAYACDVLLTLLSSYDTPQSSVEAANLVIQPLLKCLHNATARGDNVMQVEILKIIRTIQFKCQDPGSIQYALNCMQIFENAYFLLILKNGMSAPAPYVREAFVNYLIESLPLFSIFFGEKLEDVMQQAVLSLCSQLAFYTQYANLSGNANRIEDSEEENEILVINENDILQVMKGLKSILHFIFFEAEKNIDSQAILVKGLDVITPKSAKENARKTKSSLLSVLGDLLVSLMRLWKFPNPQISKDFKFSLGGILGYSVKDDTFAFDLYVKEQFNVKNIRKELTLYQNLIVSLFEPIFREEPSILQKIDNLI